MTKSKIAPSIDNPLAVNFDAAGVMLQGRRAYADLCNTMMKYQIETLDFLKKRFEQDMRLASGLAKAREADETVCCYLDFLRQAQIDYSEETAKLLRINADMAADVARKAEHEANAMTGEYLAATAA